MNNIERRRNHKLRAVFEELYRNTEHCHDRPRNGLPEEWVVFRAARAACPRLSTLDLFQFAMASTRRHRNRHAGPHGNLAF